jgi:hypothetical protein
MPVKAERILHLFQLMKEFHGMKFENLPIPSDPSSYEGRKNFEKLRRKKAEKKISLSS